MQVKLKIFQSPKSRGFLDPNIDQNHHQIANVCSKAMEITTKIGKRLTENTSCFHLVTQTYNFNAQIIKTSSKSKLILQVPCILLVFHHPKKTWSSNAFPFASLQSASRQAQRHWCFLRICCLLTTVDGRDLKKPLGMVLEPVVNNGISTTNLPQLGRAYRISNEPPTVSFTKPQILRKIRGFPWNLSTKLETCVVEPAGSWSCFFSFELMYHGFPGNWGTNRYLLLVAN